MKDLLNKWKIQKNHQNFLFNEDGIVNEEIWKSRSPKILFVFKEAYHNEFYEEYSLVKDLDEHSPWKMWNRVAEWVYAINNTTDKNIAEYRSLSQSEKHNLIKQIAVINIKKSNGKSKSNHKDLMKYAIEDKAFLRRQIEIINPDVIICGNTGEYIDFIYDGALYNEKEYSPNWFYFLDSTLVISYCHPANQSLSLLNFYGLTSIYHHALRTKLKIDS